MEGDTTETVSCVGQEKKEVRVMDTPILTVILKGGETILTRLLKVSEECFLEMHDIGIAHFLNEDAEKRIEKKLLVLENYTDKIIKDWQENKKVPHFDYFLDYHAALEKTLKTLKNTQSNEFIKNINPLTPKDANWRII